MHEVTEAAQELSKTTNLSLPLRFYQRYLALSTGYCLIYAILFICGLWVA